MSSTDDRIVRMQFDNAKFKQGAVETKTALENLDKAVVNAGKGKGLLDLNKSMQQVGVSASKMAIVTTTALATIANKATNVAIGLANSLTLSPIRSGFAEYESLLTKQNTIMNSTGLSAKVVKKTLGELNHFSDQTIYSFGNMTDAVTKFTNAGVSLPMAVKSIKGIANAAAFAGASSEEAGRAMIGFSQAIGTGFMGLMDWTQVENANMGTVKFKQQLIDAAVAQGTLTKTATGYVTKAGNATSATKGWRDALQDQWLTTEVLNSTLAKYTDEQTKLGRQAIKSAKEVRTFSAFMDTLKESIGSGWASIFQSLFGNLKQSTKFWTGVADSVNGAVQSMFGWLGSALKTWRQMGGFNKTLEGFSNLLAPIGAILDVIGTAFRTAFPDSGAGSGKALYGLSAGFAAITTPLQWLADLIRLLTKPMTLFFQIIKLGGEAVGRVVGVVKDFVTNALGLVDLKAPAGGFIEWLKDVATAAGDALDKVSKMLSKGSSIKEAFGSISFPKRLFDQAMPSLPDLGSMFGGGDGGTTKASAGLSGLLAPLGGIDKVLEKVGQGFESLGDMAEGTGNNVSSGAGKMKDALVAVWNWLGKVFGAINFQDVIASFNIAVLATFMLSVARFLNTMSGAFKGFVGIGDKFNDILGSTDKAIGQFAGAASKNAWANLIIKTALAILVLAAAMWILSKIPYDRLASGFVIIFGLFRLVSTAVTSITKSVDKMSGKKSSLKIMALSASILILGLALILLAAAMLIYNKVDLMSVVKGTVVMFLAMKVMEKIADTADGSAKKMIAGSFAIGVIAASMIVLAGALLLFKLVDWGSMLKAGAALGVVALAVGLLGKLPARSLAAVGLAMMTTAAALVAITVALLLFALVKWESIGKLAVVLGALALSLGVMMALGGPVAVSGLFGLGLGLLAIAAACLVLNKVNWSSIAKAAVVLTLLLVAAALGATILTIFLYAIAPVSPVLGVLALALIGLGIAFAAFAAGLAVAAAIAAGGTAVFAALATGAAVALVVFAQTLAAEAPILKKAFLDMLRVFFEGIAESIPIIVDGLELIWAAIKKEFEGKGGDTAKEGGKTWLGKIMEGLNEKKDQFFRWLGKLLDDLFTWIKNNPEKILTIGTWLLLKFLEGLATQADDFMDVAFQMMTNLARAVGRNAGPVTDAGLKAIVDMLNGMATAIRSNSGEVGEATANLTDAMIGLGGNIAKGIAVGIRGQEGSTRRSILNLVAPLPSLAADLMGVKSPSRVFMKIGAFMAEGLAVGIQDSAALAIVSVASMMAGTIATATEYINEFIQKLDQRTLAAQAKAAGLASAAEKAAKAADKTKSKKDDKAAGKLADQAEKADKKAQKLEEKAEKAKDQAEREKDFAEADTAEKAIMRSEDAQAHLDEAKAAEFRAAAALNEADALDKQAKAKGVSKKQAKALKAEADRLRKVAEREAKLANAEFEAAKKSAGEALSYQTLAGAEAAAAFQAEFEGGAKEAANKEAFEKLTTEQKAAKKREEAAALQAQAEKDLADAKQLAFSDLDAANELAKKAMAGAEAAREALAEAVRYESGSGASVGGILGTVVDMAPTDAAAIAMQGFEAQFATSSEAAALSKSIEFNQYNTSPEALSPTEVYRQTNNQFAFAVERLLEAV